MTVPSATELFCAGNSAFVDDDFEAALASYSSAIQLDTSNPSYYLKRSIAHGKLLHWNESKQDAEACIMLSQGDTAMAATGYLRKGMALYECGKYQEARDAFESSVQIAPGNPLVAKGIAKCAEKGVISPTIPPVAIAATSTAQSVNNALPPSKVRHEWFQNENFITVSIFIKNVAPPTCQVDFSVRDLSLMIKKPDGTDLSMQFGPLAHDVVPAECKYAVMGTKVEVKLKKKDVGIKWGALEGDDEMIAQKMGGGDIASAPVYPSSSKKVKDWDKVSKQITDDKPEGEQALNSLFQQIYKDAPPETQRAMIKSFTESNGTCLSTNWNEVGSKRVEVTPPEGMESRKYEK